ncbi:hypothetical protein V6N13_094697 [Hibiscus sabdariffa]|uniref:Aluminum-activated malate transporter n=1 Tax=Hibiscus sabdariffa TaxID=183260 RepID=A0ABR2A7Q9_9ROSI
MISVSGYRDDQVLKMAHVRFLTILVGSCTSLIVCICVVFPVWIGEDLHNSVAANIAKLANFLEAFGDEYFKVSEGSNENNKPYLQGYRSVLTSKRNYDGNRVMVRSGSVIHGKCTSKLETSLGTVLTKLKLLTPTLTMLFDFSKAPAEICGIIQEPCKRLKESCGRAQKPPQNKLVGRNRFTREIIPAASVASLLMEIIECIEKISEAVNELGKAASFRTSNATALPELPDSIQQETVQQDSNSTAILPVPHCVRVVVE